ncbi:pectinesterase [Synchytrium endobioticum]|nr:pectinesterase [Synchytrium endobioticum]
MFKKIQEAVDSLPTNTTEAQVIMIAPGKYFEQVTIPDREAPLVIYGLPTPSLSFDSNVVTISYNRSRLNSQSDYDTATLRIQASKVRVYNVNVENTSPPSGHQALALAASAGRQGYYACQFSAFQDTIMTDIGHQVYARCMVSGLVDFIFGEQGRSLFTKCHIRVLPGPIGFITASGRDSAKSQAWIVLDQCKIDGGDTNSTAKIYLGRPWGDDARVTVQNSYMSSIINPDGWTSWDRSDPTSNTKTAVFAEFNNTGYGALGARKFSTHVTSLVTIDTLMGVDYANMSFVDTKFL